eukprot:9057957-Pyramimonas_sp.AAC.1
MPCAASAAEAATEGGAKLRRPWAHLTSPSNCRGIWRPRPQPIAPHAARGFQLLCPCAQPAAQPERSRT